MNSSRFVFLGLFIALVACNEMVSHSPNSRILIMGDSLLATNSLSGNSVAQVIEAELGEDVIDRSVRGGSFLYPLPITGNLGLNISKQFRSGPWDWVVLNGGGNDLWLGCGCNECGPTMTQLISHNSAQGEIPRLASRLRQSGARVIYVGYLRSPGSASLIDHCRDEGAELERRIRQLDETDTGFYFISLEELVPMHDRSFHQVDLIHPSIKASHAIAQRVTSLIAREGR